MKALINLINKKYTPLLILLIMYVFVIFQDFGTINRDGLLYITQAELLEEKNFIDAIKLHPQFFYAFLIFIFKKFFFVSTYFSALIVNSFLFFIFVFYFMKITEEVIKDNTTVRVATVLVLVSCIPLFDNYLSMVIRDHGMWTCLVLGMYYHINSLKNSSNKKIFLAQFYYFFGSLFRLELIFLYICSPIISLIVYKESHPRKLNYLALSYSLLITVIIISIFFAVFYEININPNSHINDIFSKIINISPNLKNIEISANNKNLNDLLGSFKNQITFVFLNYIFFWKFFVGLGLATIPLLFFLFRKEVLEPSVKKFLLITFLISISIVYLNFITDFVLTSRYFVSSWIIIFILCISGFVNYINYYRRSNSFTNKIFKLIIVTLYIFNLLIIFIDSEKQNLEKISANWIKNNINLSEFIFFESARIAFYSGYDLKKLVTYEYVHNKNFDIFNYLENFSPKYVILNDEKKLDLNCCSYKIIKAFTSDNKKKNVYVYENLPRPEK